MRVRMSVLRRNSKVTKKLQLSKEHLEQFAQEKTVINSYLMQRDVPDWFRGMSQFQLEAAGKLQNAIRDDNEQRTTHRVRECIMRIGLEPQITINNAKLLMRLSRGNDLAFLWFLLEMCYRTDGPAYSVNEQLIMSSMSHLDLITTLRELDRILPQPDQSKKEWERRRLWQEVIARPPRPVRRPPPPHRLPYFHKLVRPHHYGKSLVVPMPDYRLNFGPYDRYKDPDYIVPNEHNRWYADYYLQPGQRIVNRIIRDAVGDVFADSDNEAATRRRAKCGRTQMLCEHHKVIKDMEATLEAELRVLARDNCLAYIDVNKRRQEERQGRIRRTLERDVERYMDQFRKMAAKTKRQVMVMSVENEADCRYHLLDLADIDCLSMDEECNETETGQECGAHEPHVQRHSTRRGSHRESHQRLDEARNKCGGDCLSEVSSNESEYDHRSSQARQSKGRVSIAETLVKIAPPLKQNEPASGFTCVFKEGDDVSPTRLNTPTPSETYFEATTDHKPFLFDYKKIFTFKCGDERDDDKAVQQAVVRALDSEGDIAVYANNSQYNITRAVDACARKHWCVGMKAHETEVAAQAAAVAEAEAEAIRNNSPLEKDRLHYDREYYDPDDKELMSQMLRDAMDRLKQNPKFVLASIPDAWKLPLLREWIYHRYGKAYSRDELTKSYKDTLKIFKALEKVTLRVRLPGTRELGSKVFIDYSCRNYLLKKSNYIKRQYYKRVNAAIMEQARIFWFAMRPYLCKSGPPRNTFFAYMPACVRDLLHFRIWQPNEYIHAKEQWDRRQYLKRQKT